MVLQLAIASSPIAWYCNQLAGAAGPIPQHGEALPEYYFTPGGRIQACLPMVQAIGVPRSPPGQRVPPTLFGERQATRALPSATPTPNAQSRSGTSTGSMQSLGTWSSPSSGGEADGKRGTSCHWMTLPHMLTACGSTAARNPY